MNEMLNDDNIKETPLILLKVFNDLEKKSITINDDERYWKRMGKVGKVCMIYTHDDLRWYNECNI
jgi:hypothetical protein